MSTMARLRANPFVQRSSAGLAKAGRFLKRWYGEFDQNGGLWHSGDIAFFGLLSIIPFSLLAISLIASALTEMPHLLGDGTATDAVLDPLRRAIPFMDARLDELLTTLANRPTSFSVLTILSLVYAASAGFEATSAGINAALETERKRRFILAKLLVAGLAILAVGGLLLWSIFSNIVIGLMAQVTAPLPDWIGEGYLIQAGLEISGITIGHYVMVHMMSTERVPRVFRWIGALMFALTFEVARWILAIYLREVASYDQYYGAAGAFFGLCLWIYVVAIVLIFSCSLIRLLEEMNEEGALTEPGREFVPPGQSESVPLSHLPRVPKHWPSTKNRARRPLFFARKG